MNKKPYRIQRRLRCECEHNCLTMSVPPRTSEFVVSAVAGDHLLHALLRADLHPSAECHR